MVLISVYFQNCISVFFTGCGWKRVSATSDFLSTFCVFVLFVYKLKSQGYERILPSSFQNNEKQLMLVMEIQFWLEPLAPSLSINWKDWPYILITACRLELQSCELSSVRMHSFPGSKVTLCQRCAALLLQKVDPAAVKTVGLAPGICGTQQATVSFVNNIKWNRTLRLEGSLFLDLSGAAITVKILPWLLFFSYIVTCLVLTGSGLSRCRFNLFTVIQWVLFDFFSNFFLSSLRTAADRMVMATMGGGHSRRGTPR